MAFERLVRHALLAACAAAGSAGAAEFQFSGNVASHNDVVRIAFTLASTATNVKVWTDSYAGGANFDPITAVWSMPGGDLVGTNDDDTMIAPGQTLRDSGLVFPRLGAGQYLFTIAAYPNEPLGTNLGAGFSYDGSPPMPITGWCQPNGFDCSYHSGTFWRVHLSGVDAAAAAPVPEPAGAALMALGLAALAGAARRQRAASTARATSAKPAPRSPSAM